MAINMVKSRKLLSDIMAIFWGLAILLSGMTVVGNNVPSQDFIPYINVIPMTIALWVMCRMLNIQQYVGRKMMKAFLLTAVLLTIVILLFSTTFVFSPGGYLNFISDRLNEQAWAYDNIMSLSKMSSQEITGGEMESLDLRKYQNSFLYISVFFRFGGDIPANICIVRAFHTFICGLLLILSAVKMGTTDKKVLSVIFMACILQPMMDTFFAVNHDAVGYFFLCLGLYIYISTFNNSISSFLAFPVYALLFYWFRRFYVVIALLMYLLSIITVRKKSIHTFVGVMITIIAMLVVVTFVNLSVFFAEGAEFNAYSGNLFHGRGFINTILVGLLGYFPWTNLFRDPYWPYHLFACLQGPMNLSVLYYLFKSFKTNTSQLLNDPIILTGFAFLITAMGVPGHASYTSAAMPFFLVAFKDTTNKQFFSTYTMLVFVVFSVGFIYNLLGLAG